MNRITHAFTILAQGAVAGATMLAPSARAVTLDGTFTNPNVGSLYLETFQVSSTSGYANQSLAAFSGYDFPITNDSRGNNTLAFGDMYTGGSFGIFGTGTNTGHGVTFNKYDYLATGPAVYQDTPFALQPATYTGLYNVTLTLSLAAPEPEAWALLVAGAAMVGGASRVARRRQATA